MPNTPLLLIHAGMRPGEIIVARADGSDPVFVPPSDIIHGFTIGKNQQKEEWAILRHYLERQPAEALIAFASLGDAEQALAELHKALLEPAPIAAEKEPIINPKHLPWLAVGALLLVVLCVLALSKKDPAAPAPAPAPTSISSPSTAAQGYYSNPPSETIPNSTSPVDTAQAQPSVGSTPSLSPGESLLKQIQQGAPANSPSAEPPPRAQPDAANSQVQAPQEPPAQQAPSAASPGDSVLQKIKGG